MKADAPWSLLDSSRPGHGRGGVREHRYRLIVTSTAYRQSSTRDAAKDKVDADNKLLGRFPLRRLEADPLRRCSPSAAS
ncbi:MAG: DUF1553 domain-containing protein [Gemmataceae bacterium]